MLRSPPAVLAPYFPLCSYISTCAMEYCKHSCRWAEIATIKRSQYFWVKEESVDSMHTHDGIVAHVHLLHPIRTCDLINQLVKKLVSSLAVSPTAMCEAKKQGTESTTYMTMTPTISYLQSNCLAICSPLHVSVHCCLFFVQSVQKSSTFPCG